MSRANPVLQESSDDLDDAEGASHTNANDAPLASVSTTHQVMGVMRSTGLNSLVASTGNEVPVASAVGKKKKDFTWSLVDLVSNIQSRNPTVKCKRCSITFVGGAARIADHMLGRNRIAKCPGPQGGGEEAEPVVMALKRLREDSDEWNKRKSQKAAATLVNCNASLSQLDAAPSESGATSSSLYASSSKSTVHGSSTSSSTTHSKQTTLSFEPRSADRAISRFFFACNIPGQIIDNPFFRDMIEALRACGPSYKVPNRVVLYDRLLDSCVRELREEEAPLRQVILRHGGTIVSDGWDDVAKNHLINLLTATCKMAFFDGTVELKSTDHEDAEFVASILKSHVERQGPLSIVQVCSDTCAVMKKSWKILCKEFPWITPTCCGAHVISLELKDVAKLPAVAEIIAKVQVVLKLFWGRKRWGRNKLREVIAKNHEGKRFGLYRAKPTRFAGKYREMQRLLRVKADLQEVVISAEYARQKFDKSSSIRDEEQGDDALEKDIGAKVKQIVLDDQHFWKPLIDILRVGMPLLKLLRLLDSDKPAIGKSKSFTQS